MTTLWDTSGAAVVAALSAERRAAGAQATGLVLSLVCVVSDRHLAAASAAAAAAAPANPCRIITVVRGAPDAPVSRLDAQVEVGGARGPVESVVLRMEGRLARHAESVVLPLLAPDTPVVTWWSGEPPQRVAHDPLGALAGRRVTDLAAAADPLAALRTRAADLHPGDTDLAWTRASLWRAALAAALDTRPGVVRGVEVAAQPDDPTAYLLAGWLAERLAAPAQLHSSRGPGITETTLHLEDGDVRLVRVDGETATLSVPGTPDRTLDLPQRELGELLNEELRRLGVDETYADALLAADRLLAGDRAPDRAGPARPTAGPARPTAPPAGLTGGGPAEPGRRRPERSRPEVLVHPDPEALAAAVAARCVTALVDAQLLRGWAGLVLTGGRTGEAILRALADTPARRAVDWTRVDVWFSDERYVAHDDPDRNDLAARRALLDHLPIPPPQVHAMPATDSPGVPDLQSAVRVHTAELARRASELAGPGVGRRPTLPPFDVVLLGLGEEGHVGSVFPGSPALTDPAPLAAVIDSPKPPPVRLTLTPAALRSGDQVWFVTTGAAKAAAVAGLLAGTAAEQLPACAVVGRTRTLLFVDPAALGSAADSLAAGPTRTRDDAAPAHPPRRNARPRPPAGAAPPSRASSPDPS